MRATLPSTSTSASASTSLGASVRRDTEEKKDDPVAIDAYKYDCKVLTHASDASASAVTLAHASAKPKEHLDKYFQGRQKEYEEKMVPVVVFTKVGAGADMETAVELWESQSSQASSSSSMKVMFTRLNPSTATCQLVIYELNTEMHERVAEDLSFPISAYIASLGEFMDDFIVTDGTADKKRSDGQGHFQADKTYTRSGLEAEDENDAVTMVIEVGWSQNLGPATNGQTLLGKAKDWIDTDVSLVLLVKLYGNKSNQKPGMLCSLVTNEGVIRVIQAGTIPAGEKEHFDTYKTEYTSSDAGPGAEELEETSQILNIDGKYIFGFGTDGLQRQIDMFPETEKVGIDGESQNGIRAALLALRGRPDFGHASINLGRCYAKFLRTLKKMGRD